MLLIRRRKKRVRSINDYNKNKNKHERIIRKDDRRRALICIRRRWKGRESFEI